MTLEELEAHVDRVGLAEVISQLSEICHLKAEHVEADWQDLQLARDWARAANKLEDVSDEIKKVLP